MTNPTLLSSVIPDSYAFRKTISQYARQYMEMMAISLAEGMNFRFLLPQSRSWALKRSTLADFFRKKFPDECISISGSKDRPTLSALQYPRDIFQVFGNKVYSPAWYLGTTKRILEQLGSKLEIVNSVVGEGGCSVRDKNLVIAADLPFADVNFFWGAVRKQGYDVFELPISIQKARRRGELGRRVLKSIYNGHLDTQMGIVFTKQDNLLTLVNGDFEEVYRDEIDVLFRKLGAKKFVVADEKEIYVRAVNFVNLPSGKVIVNERCKNSTDFLKRNLGIENVLDIKIPRHLATHDGPLRCRTNVF